MSLPLGEGGPLAVDEVRARTLICTVLDLSEGYKYMPYEYNRTLTPNAQDLRKNMTPDEKHLWYDFLKRLPLTVNRQKMIGPYITDFYIHYAKIVIELDDVQHEARENKEKDEKRDEYFESQGITVLRYSNTVVRDDFNFVCQDILNHLGLDNEVVKK